MGEKPFKCDYKDKEGKECKFATARKDTLTKHKKIHINREYIPKPTYNYICEKCNESFDTQEKFVNHILKHPGYKPFKCNYKECKFSTHRKDVLYTHIKDHTDENNVYCEFPGCDFVTKRKSNLKDHMRIHKEPDIFNNYIEDYLPEDIIELPEDISDIF